MNHKTAIGIFAVIILAGVIAGFASRARQVPRVLVDRLEHDFGRVRYGDIARTTFQIHNADELPLVVGDIRTSCGCTKASIDRNVIPIASDAILSISFDPAVHKDDSDVGEIERLIYVKTNDPTHPELTFRIRAVVYKN